MHNQGNRSGGNKMSKYLVQFSYTAEGVKGLLKEGGSKRRQATEQLVKSLGGKLEAYYFTYGEYDGFSIIDGLDDVEMSSALLTVAASGAVRVKTTVLLTAEQVDQAAKKTATYRPPGE
jgi:uncharacterized protein with GYD domain